MTHYDGHSFVTLRWQDPYWSASGPEALVGELSSGALPSTRDAALRRPAGAAGPRAGGLVAAKTAGRTRLYRIKPQYFAYDDLQKYLLRLTEPEEGLRSRIELMRRRPRRAGKAL